MSSPFLIALVFLCGFGAGVLYFSGLMITILTVRRVHKAGLFLMGSFILRAALAGGVFFAVSDGQWQKSAVCLVGFILARQTAVLLWRPSGSRSGKEIEAGQWRS